VTTNSEREGDLTTFYEIELEGVVYRIPRQETAEAAAAILAGRPDPGDAAAAAFGGLPQVQADASVEVDPGQLS